MANTLKDIITDTVLNNIPSHREKWTREETEELVNAICDDVSDFLKYQLS